MAPSTKPPSTYQARPPLTSRIRASFDGKRSKSVSRDGRAKDDLQLRSPTTASNGSPTANGFFVTDTDTLREAIDQAVNSETFQTAIAAHLAKIIKPSIKSALDTIQPVVEAVYTHEMLLRKTNQSVENVLDRLTETESRRTSQIDPDEGAFVTGALADPPVHEEGETTPVPQEMTFGGSSLDLDELKKLLEVNNTRTAATLADLSTAVETNTGKIAEVAQGVNEINASIRPTEESVESLKTLSEFSITTMSTLQAQLDQLKTDMAHIIEVIGTDLGKHVQAIHERGMAEPDTSFLAEHTTKLDAISTDLAALKGHADTTEKIDAIATELTALKGSVESGIASDAEGFTGLGAQITSVLTAIEGHTAVVGEINEKPPHPDLLAAIQQSNDSHASHTAALTELKERSVGSALAAEGDFNPDVTAALQDLKTDLASLKENIEAGLTSNKENVTGLGAKIDTVLTTIEGHKASGPSAEILAAVQQSNESHASHVAAWEEIKAASSAHTTALEGLGSALQGLKSLSVSASPADGESGASLEPHITSIVSTLEAHTAVLDELKASSGAHATALESHGTALEGIKSLGTGSKPVPSTVDLAPLEAQIAAIIATLEAHSSSLDEIKTTSASHSSALEGHGAALESIKSIAGSDTPAIDGSNLANLEAQVTAIIETLQIHTTALDELKGTTASHATALTESRSIEPARVTEGSNLTELETKIEAICSTLDAHGIALEEIKATGGSHTSVLDEIKTTSLQHASALDDIRSPSLPPIPAAGMPDSSNLAALEIQVGSIVNTLSIHTSALADIGTRVGSSNIPLIPSDNISVQPGINSDLNTVIEILDAHTAVLNEIKEDVSAEILTALHNLDQRQEDHTNMLMDIREADLSEEILTLLHSSGDSHAGHAEALEKIQQAVTASNESHAVHAATLEEIKSKDVESRETAPAQAVDFSGVEAQIATMIAVLEDHKATLGNIKDSAAASHELHVAHGSSLDEIKSRSVDTAPAIEVPSFEVMEGKIDLLIASLDEHKATLAEIKETTSASHELHASHTASLDELKSRSVEPAATPDFSGVEAKIDGIVASLDEHKATLSSIHEATAAANDLHASHTASLDELKSRSIEPAASIDLSGTEAKIDGIVASLDEHKATLSSIQESASGLSELHASHTASLDELKSRSVEPGTAPALAVEMPDFSGLEIQIAAIAASLEGHKAALVTIQELSMAHAASLDEVKTRSIDPEQIGGIVTALDEHKATLSAIQEATIALHKLHIAHGNSLDEIKAKAADPEHISGIADSLEEHTASLMAIREITTASHDLHIAHAGSLDEIKSRSVDATSGSSPGVNIEGLEVQIGGIITTLEEQKAVLSELKELNTGFSDSHASHSSILSEIKDNTIQSNESHASHAAILTELRSAQQSEPSSPSTSISALETHLNTIITTLESQTSTLSELKEKSTEASPEILDAIKQSHDLVTANHELLSSHTGLLDVIRKGTSHEDILTNLADLKSVIESSKSGLDEHGALVKELHSETKDNHSSLTAAIAGLALGGAAGMGTDVLSHDGGKEILEEVKAIHAILEGTKESVTSMQNQIEINHTTITTSLSSLGDEIKSEIDASATGLGERIGEVDEVVRGVDGNVKAIDLAPVHAAFEKHGADVKDIASQLEGIDGSVKAIDLGSVHAAFEQHGTAVQGLSAQIEGINGNVKAIDLAPLHSALAQHGTAVQGLSSQLEGIDGGIKAIDLDPVHTALERNSNTVQGLSTQLEGINGNVKDAHNNILALHNGVHLNDTGLGQLKEHAISIPGSAAPMDEGTWFKRTPSFERKNTVETKSHSAIPAAVAGLALGGAAALGGEALLDEDEDYKIQKESALERINETSEVELEPESQESKPHGAIEEAKDVQHGPESQGSEVTESDESKNMDKVDREPKTVSEEQGVDVDAAAQEEAATSDIIVKAEESKAIEPAEQDPEPSSDIQDAVESESQEEAAQINAPPGSEESKEVESAEHESTEVLPSDTELGSQEEPAQIDIQPEAEETNEVEPVAPEREALDIQPEIQDESAPIDSQPGSDEVKDAESIEPVDDVQIEQEPETQEPEQPQSSDEVKEAEVVEAQSKLPEDQVEPSSEPIGDVQREQEPDTQESEPIESSKKIKEADTAEPESEINQDSPGPSSEPIHNVHVEESTEIKDAEPSKSSEDTKEVAIDKPESEINPDLAKNSEIAEDAQESQPEPEIHEPKANESQPEATVAGQPPSEIEEAKEAELIEPEERSVDEPVETLEDPKPVVENETEAVESEPVEHIESVDDVPVPEASEPDPPESIEEPSQQSEVPEPSEPLLEHSVDAEPETSENVQEGIPSDEVKEEIPVSDESPVLDEPEGQEEIEVNAGDDYHEPSHKNVEVSEEVQPSLDDQEIPVSDEAKEETTEDQDENLESEPFDENPRSGLESDEPPKNDHMEHPEVTEKSEDLDEPHISDEPENVPESDTPTEGNEVYSDEVVASDPSFEEKEEGLEEKSSASNKIHEEIPIPESSEPINAQEDSETREEPSGNDIPGESEIVHAPISDPVVEAELSKHEDMLGDSEVPSDQRVESTEPESRIEDSPHLNDHDEVGEAPTDTVVQDEPEHHQEAEAESGDASGDSGEPKALDEKELDVSHDSVKHRLELPTHEEALEKEPASHDFDGNETENGETLGEMSIDESQQLDSEDYGDATTEPTELGFHDENVASSDEHLDHVPNSEIPDSEVEHSEPPVAYEEQEYHDHQLSDEEILAAQAHSPIDDDEDPEEFRRMLEEHESPNKHGLLDAFDAHDPTEQEYISGEDVKPEGALSPIDESPIEEIHTGVEDPFSQESDILPPNPQVQLLSHPSTFSSSHMSESLYEEPQLREIGSSQLSSLQNIRSSGFNSEGPVSDEDPNFNFGFLGGQEQSSPLRREILSSSLALHSSTSHEPFPPFRELQALAYSPDYPTHERGGQEDFEPISPIDRRPSPLRQAILNFQHRTLPVGIQDFHPSNITSPSSSSAFNSFSPRSASPSEQQNFSQIPRQDRHDHAYQLRDLDEDYGGFGSSDPPHEVQRSFPLITNQANPYSRRSTWEQQDHAVPRSAPAAEHQAPSATKIHYELSSHRDSRLDGDPFAPPDDYYATTDVLDHYEADTPFVYGPKPAAASRTE
jgi:hypothetical protein